MSPATTGSEAMEGFDADQQELLVVLDDFVERLQRGETVDVEALIQAHPQLADRLRSYLDSLMFVQRAVPQLTALSNDLLAAIPCEACRLGEFEIIRELGRGGMGIVYEAMQVTLGRKVALKVLPFAAVLDQEQIARFTIEAQAAARLHHPHIVPVYSVGCERGVHYYSMQFIEGQSLEVAIEDLRRFAQRDEIAQSQRNPGQAANGFSTSRSTRNREFVLSVADLGAQVADALQHAHDGGIVHRDIKPSNILIDRAGRPWVTDFGLARCQADSSLTITGAVIGSVRYMSPEQALGRTDRIDHRTDIYSLGITLYEFLTLRKAFDADDRQHFMRQIENDEPAGLRRINPAVPADLETIVLKAISKRRSERYGSARELADDLRRFTTGQPIRARRPSWLDRAGKWAGRHRTLAAWSFVALLVAFAGTAIAALLIVHEQAQTQRALTLAEQNLQHAEANLRQAHSVVDHFGLFAAERLGGIPGTESLRRQLLDDTLRYYQQFIEHAGGDLRLQADIAVTCFKSAELLERLGDRSQALRLYERAETEFRELSEDPALAGDMRQKLAMCYNNIALLRASSGETPAAHEAYRKAITLQEALIHDEPADWEYERDLALMLGNLGLLYSQTGQTQKAAACYERAIQIQERLVEHHPEDRALRRRLATTCNNASFVYQSTDLSKALEFSSRSLQVLRALAASETSESATRSDLGLALNNQGSLLARSGELQAAQTCYAEAIEVYERLAKESPAITRHQLDLAVANNNLGRTLNLLDEHDVAEAALVKACAVLQGLVGVSPSDVNYRSSLGGALNNLGLVHERTGRLEEAVSAYRTAVEHQQAAFRAAPEVDQIRLFLARSRENLQRALAATGHDQEFARVAASQESPADEIQNQEEGAFVPSSP